MSQLFTYFFSHLKNLSVKQHLRAKTNLLPSTLTNFVTWSRRLYVILLISIAVRFLLASLVQYVTHQTESQKNLMFFRTLIKYFQYDASIVLLTTSVAYFQNAFFLLCIGLMVSIALTVDWLLFTKYGSLIFRQSYDLLVVNAEHLFFLNKNLFKLKSNFLLNLANFKIYFKLLRSIWKGTTKLKFASPVLRHFDSVICTQVVRGKVVMYVFICEFLTTTFINGAGVYKRFF